MLSIFSVFSNKKHLINTFEHMKIEFSEGEEYEFVPAKKIIQTFICLNSKIYID